MLTQMLPYHVQLSLGNITTARAITKHTRIVSTGNIILGKVSTPHRIRGHPFLFETEIFFCFHLAFDLNVKLILIATLGLSEDEYLPTLGLIHLILQAVQGMLLTPEPCVLVALSLHTFAQLNLRSLGETYDLDCDFHFVLRWFAYTPSGSSCLFNK
jgi:hypothetical protein